MKEESQCKAEEMDFEVQETIKEKGNKEEVSWLKTREEVRKMHFESILVSIKISYNYSD